MTRVERELRRLRWQVRVARLRRSRRVHDLPGTFAEGVRQRHGQERLACSLSVPSGLVDDQPADLHRYASGTHRTPQDGARAVNEVLRDLRRLRRGDIGWGYLPSLDVYLEEFEGLGDVVLFIYRDPRDKIVSQIHYATGIHEGHALRQTYLGMETMDEQDSSSHLWRPGLVQEYRRHLPVV